MPRAGVDLRRLGLLWFAAAASSVALRPVWLALAPLAGACPLHAMAGIPCPSCGTTRAGVAFLQGRPLEAFALNPLATIAGAVFLAGGLLAPLWLLAGAPLPASPLHAAPRVVRFGAAAAIAGNWIYLIARGV